MTNMHLPRRRASIRVLTAAAAAAALPLLLNAQTAAAQAVRVMGIDASEFQGTISWSTVKNTAGKSFAFIRATRGGTTGTSPSGGTSGTGLARYDDPTFYTNISNAKAAGVYAGPYHFARADISASTGVDEANHFLQRAGAYMKPGYLLPVLDLEAGSGRSVTDLSNWCIDFANTIHAATGVYPIIYVNSSYAMDEVNSSVVTKMPNQWLARPDTDSDPANGNPIAASAHLTPATGKWSNWMFWQYDIPSVDPNPIHIPGISNSYEVDLDAGHGTTEWLRDFLVPAYWTSSSGSWSAASNWNSNNPAYNGTIQSGPPSRAPGNISGTPNLSGIDDTVILDNTMTAAAYTVTLDAGSYNIRKLYVERPLNITGGSLTINYDPTTAAAIGSGSTILGSTAFSAQFSQVVSMTGGALSVHTLLVDAGRTFSLSGGTLTLDTLRLTAGTTPAKLLVNGNVTFNPLNGADAIVTTTSTTNSGLLDLGGGTRTLTVGDGSAAVDLTIDVPLTNGSFTKSGSGTLQLNKSGTLNAPVMVSAGTLIATQNNQLGTAVTLGSAGSLQLSGGRAYSIPLTIGGAGSSGVTGTAPGNPGALHALSGNSTWSGPVTLAGSGANGTDPLINQVSAASGSTLTLSGVISSTANGAFAKSDDGDLVLTGSAPNTYTGITRLYGGRIIVEKDAALGSADNHTFMLAGSASTIAFRAPASSPAGFTYSSQEVIHTEGSGAQGYGQVDNLSGNNTFAGSIAVTGSGSIGVTAGSLTIAGGLYARSGPGLSRTINKLGAGTLVLTGDSSLAPPAGAAANLLTSSTLNVAAGTVDLRSPSPSTANVSGVTTYGVSAGAALLNTTGTLTDASLSVAGAFHQSPGARLQNVSLVVLPSGTATLDPSNTTPSLLASLSLVGSGRLDLTGGDLALDYADASSSPSDYVRQKLLSGRAGGSWTGLGLVSSAAAGDAQLRTAIGYAEAAVLGLSDFAGTLVDPTTLLLEYTWYGDANLDGRVDADDFALIDRGYARGLVGWVNGDFDYDGAVTPADYLLIDRVAAQSNGGTLAPSLLAQREAQFGAGYVDRLIAAVPEPSLLAAGLVTALPLFTRRRRADR